MCSYKPYYIDDIFLIEGIRGSYVFIINGWAITDDGDFPLRVKNFEDVSYDIKYYDRQDVKNYYALDEKKVIGFGIRIKAKSILRPLHIVVQNCLKQSTNSYKVYLWMFPYYKLKTIYGKAKRIFHDGGIKLFLAKCRALINRKLIRNSGGGSNNTFKYIPDTAKLAQAVKGAYEKENLYVHKEIYKGTKKYPVKLICFYLPQYHEIPENDSWWGKGFTEWTNVKPAKPLFTGHYQPRMPGELGYYNLLDSDVQKKQIELAKNYGIYGFCFYFYWFNGKRLLEKPILNYLENKKLDFPFCLCWANENWTRRWDGLENEVLIGQKHSKKDDISFIAYISQYFNDARYIKINDKPLLIVYRPSLLPNVRKTALRWRKWCRDQGYGEIYLASTQSFERDNPQAYGFDAAIEFPPNNFNPPIISSYIVQHIHDLAGNIYDWRYFVEMSKHYSSPPYKLFRGVCPSWDNTPRKKNNANVFVLNTPDGYKKWLQNAIKDTLKRFDSLDERVVFINAWNEWAEGTYMEPDKRYGYAYLQATYEALTDTVYGAM